MEPIKLGYVGCGFMAQRVHIPNFIGIDDCELIALAEVRSQLGRKVQERHKIQRLYVDHLELAQDPEIEAVAVSADFALQGEIPKDLLRAGKHVFMEKPALSTDLLYRFAYPRLWHFLEADLFRKSASESVFHRNTISVIV
jgi:predicted dehydrogenase